MDSLTKTTDGFRMPYSMTAKAFNRVIHSLLYELQVCEITDHLLDFLRSFLTDRNFFVMTGNAISKPLAIPFIILKGSVLRPPLFLICISDIHLSLPSSSMMYGDDGTIWGIYKSLLQLAINKTKCCWLHSRPPFSAARRYNRLLGLKDEPNILSRDLARRLPRLIWHVCTFSRCSSILWTHARSAVVRTSTKSCQRISARPSSPLSVRTKCSSPISLGPKRNPLILRPTWLRFLRVTCCCVRGIFSPFPLFGRVLGIPTSTLFSSLGLQRGRREASTETKTEVNFFILLRQFTDVH